MCDDFREGMANLGVVESFAHAFARFRAARAVLV
jgi:hypothetical protein